MAIYYLYSARITKPTAVTWWSDAFPDQAKERVDTCRALNLADPWIFTIEDGDNQTYQMYFTSTENFNKFIETSSSLSSSPLWHSYNYEHGIVETILHSGLVEVDPVNLPPSNRT
jgi:hypothetical protein